MNKKVASNNYQTVLLANGTKLFSHEKLVRKKRKSFFNCKSERKVPQRLNSELFSFPSSICNGSIAIGIQNCSFLHFCFNRYKSKGQVFWNAISWNHSQLQISFNIFTVGYFILKKRIFDLQWNLNLRFFPHFGWSWLKLSSSEDSLCERAKYVLSVKAQ